MTTCIYFEQEVVSPDDARRARDLAGREAREVTQADTNWSAEIDGPPPERLVHSRSQQVLEDWMPQVAAWGACLEETAPGVTFRHGISLAEVAKLELLFALTAAAQRWQSLTGIRRRWNPDRLLWITSRADAELNTLCRAAADLSIEIHRGPNRAAPSTGSAWHTLKSVVGPPVKRAGAIARAAMHAPRWPNEQPDIVCTEYFPNSVAGSVLVAEELQSRYDLRIGWIAARQKAADALAAHGIESLLLPELMSVRTHRRAGLNGAQRRALRSALRGLPDKLFGGPAETGAREYLSSIIEPRILRAWNEAAYWVEAYHEVFSKLPGATLLSTTYSSSIGRAAALAARRFGGRAIFLQHGLFPRCSAYCSFCHDLLLMWGPNELRNLTDFGVDPQSIRITGSVIYDELIRRSTSGPGDSLPRPGEPLKVALMASRTGGLMVSYAQAKTCLLTVAAAVSQLRGAHLTVKLHPSDHTGMVPEAMREFPQFTVVSDGNAQDVILQSDVVIVVSSTTGIEACVADKPLIVLDVFDDPNTVPYTSYRAAVSVPIGEGNPTVELARVLARLRDDSTLSASLAAGRRRLVDDMLNGAAGDAVDQAASAVARALDLCEANPLAPGSRNPGVPHLPR